MEVGCEMSSVEVEKVSVSPFRIEMPDAPCLCFEINAATR